MGLLSKSSRGGLLTRRGGVFAVVAAVHVVVLVVAMHAHSRAVAQPEVVAIKLAILQEEVRQEAPPRLEPPPLVKIVVPRIDIPMIEFPESQAMVLPPSPPPPTEAAVASPPVATRVTVQSAAPVSLNVDEVDYLRMPEPRYPRAAKQARLQGTVLVWVMIDLEGRPRDVRVHRSSGYEQLDREGCDAVSHALFRPYREHGVPRLAQVIVPIEFTLGVRGGGRH